METVQWCEASRYEGCQLVRVKADESSQENKSDCSIFTFDILENKSRLPLARNAVRKLRTLRHPGVIKVLDTVEVLKQSMEKCPEHGPNGGADRHVHIRCDRASDAAAMACAKKSPERGDTQVGIVHDRGMTLYPEKELY